VLTTSELIEQDADLGQLHQTVGPLQEEKAKESERAEKLTEELKGEILRDQSYCWSNILAQWILVMPIDYRRRVKA